MTVASELAAVRAANSRLRDKLLEIAKECAGCGGTGCVTRVNGIAGRARVEPCPQCADIREALE